MGIRILLADDHKIMREGLRSLLEKEDDMEVIAEAEDGRRAIELAGKHEPDVVVMDVAMPEQSGVEATRRILEESSNVSVIALSMHADRPYVARMLEAGASGYLLKDCAFEELVTAIRTVVAHGTYLSPKIAHVVVEGYVSRLMADTIPARTKLTRRERGVLQRMAGGQSTKEIAFALNVSVKTIETHRRNIMQKLDIHSVAELTKYAIREGLSSLDV
jgi:DNA-binding NarL/FixJ family response regulator